MIISRYLNKEALNALLAVTFVLLLIFLSNQLVRYLSYAAAGKVAANILLELMGFEIPYLLALLLPLALYLGIVLAYGRLYADSELRVLHACGLSVTRLLHMTSLLIIVVSSVVLVLTLWVNPWLAKEKNQLIAKSLTEDNILDTLMPGRFQVSNDGRRVLYVENVSRDRKQAKNIFIADQKTLATDTTQSVWNVLAASSGAQLIQPEAQGRFIVAEEGYRYEGTPGQNDYKIMQFKKYAVRLPQTIAHTVRQEQESVTTSMLWKNYADPMNAAELQWRLSIPLSALLLGCLAIPLSRVPPRHGRYIQLVPALLIYVIYINLLFVARNWVELNYLPQWVGMGWVHMLVISLLLASLLLPDRWRRWRAKP